MGHLEHYTEILIMTTDNNKNLIDISVVIPAKNEEKYLGLCLDAVQKAFKGQARYEIIVVDNFSTDRSVEISESYKCKVIKNPKIGPASSRNMGVSVANGELIAFIDADCLIDQEWLRFTKEHFDNENVVAVGTKVCPDFNNATWVEKSLFNLNQRRGKDISENVRKVRWIGTSNMLVRKKIFKNINGFNEKFITAEDYDLGERLSKIGDILLDRRILTVHLRESKTLKELFVRELWRGQNNLRHWSMAGYSLYEMPSIFMPLIFLCCTVMGLFSIFFNLKFSIFCCLIVIICASAGVFGSKKRFSNPLCFIQCALVVAVYLLGRGTALIKESFLMLSGGAYENQYGEKK